VLSPLNVALLNKVLQPIANCTARWVILLFKLHDEIGNDVTSVLHHLIKNFIRVRWDTGPRHIP
jgi:hypothetical protein